MLSQSHMPHCRVLAPSEFSVMIPELMPHCRVLLPGKFNDMSFQSHVSRCRVGLLPLGEFTVMMIEPHATLQGAATGRIHCHDSRATLLGAATWWIHCPDSRVTCHIAGCSHLAKSLSWSCHIAGCKNSVRHIENRFRHISFFSCLNAVWALMSDGFRMVSDTLVSFVRFVFLCDTDADVDSLVDSWCIFIIYTQCPDKKVPLIFSL